MAVAILRPRGALVKPPVGSEIDWGNSFADGLLAAHLCHEGAGKTLTDLVGNHHLRPLVDYNHWAHTQDGLAANCDYASGGGFHATINDRLKQARQMTFAWRGTIGTAGGGANGVLFGVGYAATESAPYVSLAALTTGTAGLLYFGWSGG